MDVRKFTAGYFTFRFTYYFMGKAYLGFTEKKKYAGQAA